MELLLIALLVLVVGGGIAFVTLRRGGETTLEPPPSVPLPGPDPAPPADVEVGEAPTEVLEAPTPTPEPLPPEPEPEPAPVVKPTFRDRLGKARSTISGYVGSVLARDKIDGETWDELEEALIRADVGVATTTDILDRLRATVDAQKITEPAALLDALKAQLKADLAPGDRTLRLEPGAPNVWLFVGVNGVGKTTTIGKLASQQVADGRRVVLAAADTFRAAAADQLQLWAERTGGEIVRGQEGADPGSIVFDAMAAANSRNADLVLVDTAGRLHTKTNLMEELKKLRRIVDRTEGACKEVLLVIDASTGQNGLVQAKQFAEAVDVTGVVLTKLDGTAKGGIVLAIQSELGIPVKVVGVGEGIGDLIEFDPSEFAAALFEGDS
jgi:fused signal recognition particle receptor